MVPILIPLYKQSSLRFRHLLCGSRAGVPWPHQHTRLPAPGHLSCRAAADANILINMCRTAAQRYFFAYQEPMPVEQLVRAVCDTKQVSRSWGPGSGGCLLAWSTGLVTAAGARFTQGLDQSIQPGEQPGGC